MRNFIPNLSLNKLFDDDDDDCVTTLCKQDFLLFEQHGWMGCNFFHTLAWFIFTATTVQKLSKDGEKDFKLDSHSHTQLFKLQIILYLTFKARQTTPLTFKETSKFCNAMPTKCKMIHYFMKMISDLSLRILLHFHMCNLSVALSI